MFACKQPPICSKKRKCVGSKKEHAHGMQLITLTKKIIQIFKCNLYNHKLYILTNPWLHPISSLSIHWSVDSAFNPPPCPVASRQMGPDGGNHQTTAVEIWPKTPPRCRHHTKIWTYPIYFVHYSQYRIYMFHLILCMYMWQSHAHTNVHTI